MPAREFLALVQEASFGTPIATPANGVSRHYPRLTADDSFKGLMKPLVEEIPSGGGYSVPACVASDSWAYEGSIQGELYPSQSKFLLDWAATRINDARTAPWATTDATNVMPPGDLASISAYHAVQEMDGTYKRSRGSGLKCKTFTLSASASQRVWKWNAGFVGVRDDTKKDGVVGDPDATEFPAPADADYPCGPWLFGHSSGGLKIGSVRTLFDSLSLSIQNDVKPIAVESPHPQLIWFAGRTVTLQVALLRRPSQTDLASYRSLAAMDVELILFNGTNTLTLDLQSAARWSEFDRQLPIGSPYKWTGTLKAHLDPASSNDFSVAYA